MSPSLPPGPFTDLPLCFWISWAKEVPAKHRLDVIGRCLVFTIVEHICFVIVTIICPAS